VFRSTGVALPGVDLERAQLDEIAATLLVTPAPPTLASAADDRCAARQALAR
jgi:hypothetical protein